MAGLGYKSWSAGDVLAAADVNGYLADQVVQVHASSAARGSALGTAVAEGMVSYTADDNALSIYNGSQWGQVSQAISPNYIINGAFDIWQRGTSFSNPAFGTYTADRWLVSVDGSGFTRTVSRQNLTPSDITSIGYGEGQHFARFDVSVAGTGNTATQLIQRIEDVRTLAGQTVTLSFWAKAASAANYQVPFLQQNFGSGGSSSVFVDPATTIAVTTSWQRFTVTYTVPSIAGKTIGAGNYLSVQFRGLLNSVFTLDLWGVQLEAGSVATPFRRNANSLQGELAACQRYYVRYGSVEGLTVNAFATHAVGSTNSTTEATAIIHLPVTMRSASFTLDYANIAVADSAGNFFPIVTMSAPGSSRSAVGLYVSGLTGVTANRPARILNNNNTSGYLGISTEL